MIVPLWIGVDCYCTVEIRPGEITQPGVQTHGIESMTKNIQTTLTCQTKWAYNRPKAMVKPKLLGCLYPSESSRMESFHRPHNPFDSSFYSRIYMSVNDILALKMIGTECLRAHHSPA